MFSEHQSILKYVDCSPVLLILFGFSFRLLIRARVSQAESNFDDVTSILLWIVLLLSSFFLKFVVFHCMFLSWFILSKLIYNACHLGLFSLLFWIFNLSSICCWKGHLFSLELFSALVMVYSSMSPQSLMHPLVDVFGCVILYHACVALG